VINLQNPRRSRVSADLADLFRFAKTETIPPDVEGALILLSRILLRRSTYKSVRPRPVWVREPDTLTMMGHSSRGFELLTSTDSWTKGKVTRG